MKTTKKHKRIHSNPQIIEPYYTIRYLFIFVTTLGKIPNFVVTFVDLDMRILYVTCILYLIASVTVYHIHRELVRPKLEHLVVYEVSYAKTN